MAFGLIGEIWSALSVYVTMILLLLSLLVIITVIFIQKKRPEAVLVWILAVSLAILVWYLGDLVYPLFLFLTFYVYLGRDHRRKKMFHNKAEVDRSVSDTLGKAKADLFVFDIPKHGLGPNESLAHMIFKSNSSFLTKDNEVEYYNEGDRIFKDMLEEIKGAKRFVHLEFYLVRNDSLAKEFVLELVKKAREGVEIKLLLDATGCQKLPRNFFKDLQDAGGKVTLFLPSRLGRLNLGINNRNHRKLFVVDGDTAFLCGCNIGVEYRGEGPLGYWRDDCVRIRGSGAISVEKRFVLDWNFAAKDKVNIEDYAPTRPGKGNTSLQIVSGGPDNASRQIEEQYVKMITSARQYVYIQTPYFVPSEAVTSALVTASKSGVDVRIMMPSKPDHIFVYWASLYSAGDMLRGNVRIHQFSKEGFIHAKVLVVDDLVASVGSANFDRRSLELNFESNAVIYGKEFAQKVKAAYVNDIERWCTELTKEKYQERSLFVKVKEDISRLYGPIA
jgi:cardiolipin synthase